VKYLVRLLLLSIIASCSQIKTIKNKVVTPRKTMKEFQAQWGKNLDPSYLSGNVPIHLNGPITHDGAIYIGSSGEGFLSINERDGKVNWKKRESETYSSSPLVFENNIIYGTENGRIISRKLVNGELNYELDLGASVDGTPIASSGRLFVQLRNHQIFSLDATTGKILWSYKKPVTNKTTIQGVGKGHVFDNKVIFGFADGDMLSFRVETGEIIWEQKIGKSSDKFMDLNWDIAEFNGKLATLDAAGNIYIISGSDGTISNQFNVGASTNLISKNGNLYFGALNGEVKILGPSLNVNTLFKFSKRTVTRIALWKNRIIAGDISGLVSVYSLSASKILKNKILGNDLSALFTKPTVGELGGLVLFTSRGRLYYYQ